MEELKVAIEEMKKMSNEELINAFNHVRDLNLSKKNYGLGEASSEYQTACYEEILRRMS